MPKKYDRYCIFALTLCALSSLHSAAFADSFWSLNGSVVRLESNGNNRSIYYFEPRSGMIDEGVRSGTLFFDGARSGNRYVGFARRFSIRCGTFKYKVSGWVSDDGTRIVLTGKAPKIDTDDCSKQGFRNSKIVLELSSSPQIASEARRPRDRSSEILALQLFQTLLRSAPIPQEGEGQLVFGLIDGIVGDQLAQLLDEEDQARFAAEFQNGMQGDREIEYVVPEKNISLKTEGTNEFMTADGRRCKATRISGHVNGTPFSDPRTVCLDSNGMWRNVA